MTGLRRFLHAFFLRHISAPEPTVPCPDCRGAIPQSALAEHRPFCALRRPFMDTRQMLGDCDGIVHPSPDWIPGTDDIVRPLSCRASDAEIVERFLAEIYHPDMGA